VDEEADPDDRKDDETESELKDCRAVLEEALLWNAPAVEEQERRQEEQEERSSGSRLARKFVADAINTPKAICTSGKGTGIGEIRTM